MEINISDSRIVPLLKKLASQLWYVLDRRDFRVLRPQHCAYFELLP